METACVLQLRTGAKAMELVLHVGRPIEYRWRPMGEKMKRDFIGHPVARIRTLDPTIRSSRGLILGYLCVFWALLELVLR